MRHSDKSACDFREFNTLFLSQFERMDHAQPVDHGVGQLGGDDFPAQLMVFNLRAIGFPHRFGETA